MSYHIVMEVNEQEVYQVLVWLQEEWDNYVVKKFGEVIGNDYVDLISEGLTAESWWWRQICQYVDRANIYGLDDPRGRQAFGKAIAVCFAALGAAIRQYGDMPIGGHTSGEIRLRGQ